jgi:hypothetical protein
VTLPAGIKTISPLSAESTAACTSDKPELAAMMISARVLELKKATNVMVNTKRNLLILNIILILLFHFPFKTSKLNGLA